VNRKTELNQTLFSAIFHTTAGWIGIISSTGGLRRVTFPHPTEGETRHELGPEAELAFPSEGRLQEIITLLRGYFSGKPLDFYGCLDFDGATTFRRAVWEATRTIPYGETRSYAWVAAQIGKPKAARAVGQALGENPLPIIVPCHRVLASDGSLCGFGGGLEMKKRLLELEINAADKR